MNCSDCLHFKHNRLPSALGDCTCPVPQWAQRDEVEAYRAPVLATDGTNCPCLVIYYESLEDRADRLIKHFQHGIDELDERLIEIRRRHGLVP